MPATTWLDRYYGKDISSFSPTVIFDGKNRAVVRIRSNRTVGYVLIKKSGKHNVTQQIPLHDGAASKADFEAMKRRLDTEDR